MSPTVRVRLLVGLLAVGAAAATAGVVLATRQTPPQPKVQCAQAPRPLLVPGVRSAETGAVAAALGRSPAAAARTLQPLAQAHPRDAVVQFNYGIAAYCAGYLNEATDAFRAAKSAGRNTYYEMRADEILHPQFFQPADGIYPVFEPQGKDPLLIQGVIAQRAGHQHTAERLYSRAARLHPQSDEAQVAAAVGRFDEDNLSASFSRLGPLVRRFPHSQSVRFHLGLLLAWTGQAAQATAEFRQAVRLGPRTPLGRQASLFLAKLRSAGTTGQSR